MRTAPLIKDILAARYGKPLVAALHLCLDLEKELSSARSATADNMDERDFRAVEALLLGHITCSDDLPEDQRPRSLNARLLFAHAFRLREAALDVVRTRTEDFGGPEAERHYRALDVLADSLRRTESTAKPE